MDDDQRLQLQSMINEHNVIDKTDMIRRIKHSSILRNEVNQMIELKKVYKNDLTSSNFREEVMSKCNFLFKYYTDIFNKLKNDELDVNMLFQFLDILEKIEKGDLNQHEASFQVGTILKNMYIDSAVKRVENMEKKEKAEKAEKAENGEKKETTQVKKSKDISWKHFKKIQNIKKSR